MYGIFLLQYIHVNDTKLQCYYTPIPIHYTFVFIFSEQNSVMNMFEKKVLEFTARGQKHLSEIQNMNL